MDLNVDLTCLYSYLTCNINCLSPLSVLEVETKALSLLLLLSTWRRAFATCLKSKCNDNIHSDIPVNLYQFPLMPWSRTAAPIPFVMCCAFKPAVLYWYVLLHRGWITVLPFAKLSFLPRCVNTSSACACAVTVSAEDCNLLGLVSFKTFIVFYTAILAPVFMWHQLTCPEKSVPEYLNVFRWSKVLLERYVTMCCKWCPTSEREELH